MKLIGHVDGVEIRFDFYPPNLFRAIIPKHLTGKYVLELKAIDEAGNYDFKTNIFIHVDFQSMSFRILENKYVFNANEDKLWSIEIKEDFSALQLESNLEYKVIDSPYSYRELVI